MKKQIFLGLCLIASNLFSASMNFGGHFRAETAAINRMNLGTPGVAYEDKTYIAARALLNPNLIVDDHFSILSQWNLLTSSAYTANATQAGGQGGYVFGDNGTTNLALSRAWLRWVSDFGVFRVGRMPFSWGYGLVWDSGDGIWDDFQTTLDRLEYRLNLGHVSGALAYSKPNKRSLFGNSNDADFYTIYLQYENPEADIDTGILLEKQVRSAAQQDEYLNIPNSSGNRITNMAEVLGTPDGQKTHYPKNNLLLDFYVKKTIKYFTFGGDIAWSSGEAYNYNGDSEVRNNKTEPKFDSFEAFAITANVTYDSHKIKTFLEALYSSGDNNLNSGSLEGFVLLNRNRRPGFILGRELLGTQAVTTSHPNGSVGMGAFTAYSSPDEYSGVLFIHPGFQVRWSNEWSSGIDVVWAQKAQAANGRKGLGVELDLGTDYRVYKNCSLGFMIGFLFPGDGLGSTAKSPLGFRATLGIDI